MNHVALIGRLTRDPDIRYTQGEKPMCVARYTLAVDRPFTRDGNREADFISCVAFGGRGEFAEKHLSKGTKIGVHGRIQTGSYTNKDGVKIYTTDVVVDEHTFCEKSSQGQAQPAPQQQGQAPQPAQAQAAVPNDGFMSIPEGIEEELPFI